MRRSCKNAKRNQVWLRLISTGLTLLMLVLLTPDGVFAQVLCSFTGTWNTTSFGEMTLTQNGSAVSGTYTHHQGRIEGAVLDGVLVGTWTEAPSRAAPTDAGDIEFRLSDDCTEFSGSWRYGSTGPMNDGWNGTRNRAAPPPEPHVIPIPSIIHGARRTIPLRPTYRSF